MNNLAKYFKNPNEQKRIYIEKTFEGSQEDYIELLKKSSTIYVSDISTHVKEERLWNLFQMAGPIKRLIMGLNRNHLTFCNFIFVEYYKIEDADKAEEFFNKFFFEGKFLTVNKDIGFSEGREMGRGVYGNKMRDDNRKKMKVSTNY